MRSCIGNKERLFFVFGFACISYNTCDIIRMTSEHEQLIEERSALLNELRLLSHMVHGSILERLTVCSRPNCQCKQGKKHGPITCIVINENGKQRQKYVPKKMGKNAAEAINEYHRAIEIIDRISQINLMLISAKIEA